MAVSYAATVRMAFFFFFCFADLCSAGTHLSQCAYGALQTPYQIFGLGRTNNYIEMVPKRILFFLNFSMRGSAPLCVYVYLFSPFQFVHMFDLCNCA